MTTDAVRESTLFENDDKPMTPFRARQRIVKAFNAAEVAYVAIADVAREYPLPDDLRQEVVDGQTSYHRVMRRLRQYVEQETSDD